MIEAQRYPYLAQVVDKIANAGAGQRRALGKALEGRNETFFARAERAMAAYERILDREQQDLGVMAEAYLDLCKEMLREQLKFGRTGQYSASSLNLVMESVYQSDEKMRAYMFGLAASQFLWPHHYELYAFFLTCLDRLQRPPARYLEIGPGHGLFLLNAAERFPDCAIDVVDLSPTSIALSRALLEQELPNRSVSFRLQDVNAMDSGAYDLIVMCEVLEHLDDPAAVLASLSNLQNDGGRMFITTCANCPAIDHVYLYRDVAHIRRQLNDCGYAIVEELAVDVNSLPNTAKTRGLKSTSYAALLEKA